MPSFGGTLTQRMAQHRVPRSVFPLILAAAAVGMLACAVLLNTSYAGVGSNVVELVGTGQGSSGGLAQMQREVQEQLVEAAKRRAKASEHRAQAVQLQAKAEDDSERAVLLHEKADLAHSNAELRRADDALAQARLQVKHLSERATQMDADAAKDTAKSDKDKEDILELEDKAGTYSEKAAAEAAKIRVVKAAEARVESKLPTLVTTAKADEGQAKSLKAEAVQHMRESAVKSAKAKKLDALARDKEDQAHAMRERLMAVLQSKAKSLELKQEAAATDEVEAKEGATKAAEMAEMLAESAEKQAHMAEAAEALSSQELPSERAAQSLLGANHVALHQAARLKEKMSPAHHEEIENRRQVNLMDAGKHAAALKAMRSRVASDEGGQAPDGVEDEDGHLQLADTSSRSSLEEDGHFSHREEAFKEALAGAYRKGYTQELSDDGGREGEDERPRSRAALESKKPARLEMLGDVPRSMEMLSKGPGDEVALEPEAAKDSSSSPMFSMLWDDGSSLGSETRRLETHTRRLRHRYATARGGRVDIPKVAALYEDGHTSREEQQFAKEMSKYRGALQQERAAALSKAHSDTQKLSELPGGYDRRRSDDFKSQQHRVQSLMLSDSHNHWDSPHRGGDLRVHENENGHLVFDSRDSGEGEMLRRDDGMGGEREDELSSTRGGRLSRIEEELRDSNRRDRRLEARTERLQGEVEALRGEGGGRTMDLAETRGGRREEGRREEGRRDEGPDGRRGRREEEERGRGRREERRGGRQHAVNKNFSPDSTYEKEYAKDPGHVSVGEIKFQHALKSFDRTKDILREGAIQDSRHLRLPELVPSHLPGQGL